MGSSLRGFGHGVSQLVELTGPKPLDTPEKFLGQLSWNAQSSHVACRDDEYEIPGTLFGLIKHMDGNDDTNFYATDKAVAWASGSIGLTKDLQDCCGKEKKQCLCNIAKNVGLLDPNNNNLVRGPGNYSFIAFTSVDYSSQGTAPFRGLQADGRCCCGESCANTVRLVSGYLVWNSYVDCMVYDCHGDSRLPVES